MIVELLVRESRVREELGARFPDPTLDMAEEISRLANEAARGYLWLVSALLNVEVRPVPDAAVDKAREYADTGALLLDEQGPKDWRDRLTPEDLDIADSRQCVLGQLYGHYETGLDLLRYPGAQSEGDRRAMRGDLSNSQWMANRGFDAAGRRSVAAMNVAWRELLTEAVPA
jgi:hypothetical protein